MMDEMESIALEQMEIMERLVKLCKSLISELAQYRRMDEEEKLVADLLQRMGGQNVGRTC